MPATGDWRTPLARLMGALNAASLFASLSVERKDGRRGRLFVRIFAQQIRLRERKRAPAHLFEAAFRPRRTKSDGRRRMNGSVAGALPVCVPWQRSIEAELGFELGRPGRWRTM